MKKIIYTLIGFLFLLSPSLFSQTIVGGTNASPDAYPWMAALADPARNLLDEAHLCGGTLIDEEWVLTAAHCITDAFSLGINELDIVLGTIDLSNPNAGYERIRVKEAFLHPGFGLIGNRNFDIALLQLETPSSRLPVKLPVQGDQTYYAAGYEGKVLGWGLADTNTYESSPILQEADIKVINLSDCNSPAAYGGDITLDMFCAGTLAGQLLGGAATGDSGGPLVVESGGEWLQTGIVSWGKELWSTAQFPGVFQKTAIHRDWIESVITDNTVANEEIPTLAADWTVYQSETALVVSINSNQTEKLNFYITDVLGRMILKQNIQPEDSNTYTIDWQKLPAGAYVIGVHTGGKYASRLVIKAK